MIVSELFKKRTGYYYRQLGKYLKYVFNDHFVIALLILLGAVGFTYSNYLETVEPDALLPRLILFAFIIIVIKTGGIRTLIQPADGIYLLPLEKKIGPVMRKNLIYSLIFSIFSAFLMAFLTAPLVLVLNQSEEQASVIWIATVLIAKTADTLLSYYSFKLNKAEKENKVRLMTNSALFSIVFMTLFYSLLIGFLLSLALMFLLGMYILDSDKKTIWNWERLIDSEQKRVQAIYKIINLFVETPYGNNKVKRMKPLDAFINLFDRRTDLHSYYISRVFFRQTSFSGLYIRLTVIGAVILALNSSTWLSVLISLLFMYLIGFQLLPLKQLLDKTVYFKLYPVKDTDKIKAIQKLISKVLLITAILFSLASYSGGMDSIIVLAANLLFVYGFVRFYIPKRLG
ncbi:ABC transporter permease [Alkalibacterium sp.]|nr:MAG: ABC transporter permease [Alkalibacterium sp.]